MVRKHKILTGFGYRAVWEGVTRLNAANYPTISFPHSYTKNSAFIDVYEGVEYTVDVTFNIDANGNATALMIGTR
jgi:hypothetical protein